MRARALHVILVLCAALGCRRRARGPVPGVLPSVASTLAEMPSEPSTERSVDELLPGDQDAFGITMPIGTSVRFDGSDMKMFRVDAQMTRVMRYLEQRLEVSRADIHPLGAMLHHASLRDATQPSTVDVGVRDEGDRTFVTIWNRTPATAPPQSLADGLRSAGIDPQTGRVLPAFNN